jgi:hypothetical protein
MASKPQGLLKQTLGGWSQSMPLALLMLSIIQGYAR